MASFGTKKPNGDMGVQLGFPLIFNQYFNAGHAYYPSDQGHLMQLLEGTNFQSKYHEEKRQYANKTVLDGLQARRSADRLLLTGPANYHVPKPVLGQRRFANPSLGQLGIESARRDGSDAPYSTIENNDGSVLGLRGGVVHTAEGYDFYSRQLKDRVNQLDRINALSLGYTVSQGQGVPTSDNTREGSISNVTFFITLRALSDAILQNDINRFTFENLKDLLRMLFTIAPSSDNETLNDAADIINSMSTQIDALKSGNGRLNSNDDDEYILTIGLFVEGMRRYTDEMIRNIYMSERDKLTLSKSLIKTLGFDRLMPKTSPQAVLNVARRGNTRINDAVEDLDADDDDGDDDDDDGEFDEQATTREDDEARGVPRAPFAGRSDDPNRSEYGRRGRQITEAPAYFDDMPTDVAPLNYAGAELDNEVPQADTSSLTESLNAAVEDVKYSLIDDLTPADAGKDIFTLINEKNIDRKDFINVLEETLLTAGLSKGDIATAMQINGNEMYSSYIAENLAEGRVPPAIRRQNPSAAAPTIRFEQAPAATAAAVATTTASAVKTQIDNATTKEELQNIFASIPEAQKRGIKKPHGNTSVANLKKILYGLV